MKKLSTISLALLLFTGFSINAQTQVNGVPNATLKEKTVGNYTQTVRKKKKQSTNKASLIWGAGSTYGTAIGEFSTAFNTAGSWTAVSINDQAGSRTPGNAFWTRSTLGYSQGGYWSGTTPVNSNSAANGVAIFDSDYLDNGGTAGAFGTGSSPSAHKGELISPAIDLTGYTDTALTIDLFTLYRNFQINELSIGFSTDGGTTYTSTSILSMIPTSTEGWLSVVFPNATQGVVNLTDCRIKLTFDGDYYFAIIDDISISTADEFDLTIQKADPLGNNQASSYETFQITNNVFSLENQINPADLRFGANIKNLGYADVISTDNASLYLDIQKENNGSWSSVYQTSTPIDTIDVFGNGTAVIDTISNQSWLEAGNFRAVYYTTISGESDRSNDTLIQTFSITEDYLSKVDVNTQGEPYYSRSIFPGGTNFNKYEFGSYFSSPNGGSDFLQFDSIRYAYYVTSSYNGSGSQIIKSNIYEWTDGGGSGTLDGLPDALAAGEHVLVASGADTLSGLIAGGGYEYSSMNYFDNSTSQAAYKLEDGKTYLITLSIEGNQFTSTSSVWLGASEDRSYGLNVNTNGTRLIPSQLFLEDGSGTPSANWLGFGMDVIPTFGVHTSSNPPLANLVISEIMYNPPESGTDSLEYIEIYNADTLTVDLNGYTFFDGISHTFSSGDTIGSGEFMVIAIDTAALRHVFGYQAAFQWSSGALSNGGEDIVLHDAFGRTVDSVDYDDGGAWPSGSALGAPDGGGSSIELIDLNTDNNIGSNWMASLEETTYLINGFEVLGSPGYLPVELSLTSTDIDCNGGANGTATATVNRGISPFTYNWSNSGNGNSISNLTVGTYTVTVTDNHGTTKIDSVALSEPTALAASTTVDSTVSCNGLTDGGATASASGGTTPYTYTWSNSATTASISGVIAGTYSVTITDNNGCTATNSAAISEPTALTASTTVDSTVSCNGLSDGGTTASATGGTTPYTYTWSNSATTASITGVIAGTYSVTITDNNGCTATNSAMITEPTAIAASTTIDSTVSCNGLSDGGATASASGGTTPYTYTWSNSATTASITGVTAGTYSVTITDNNGCTTTNSATISEPTALFTSTTIDSTVSCNGLTDGGATASASGGTTPYTYTWSNSATTASITGVTAGTYSVTITDNNGCTATNSAVISEPTALAASTSIDSSGCSGLSNGGATASATGGSSPYTYTWSNSATTASITGVPAGTYTVTVTDNNGCTDTDQLSISSNPAPSVDAGIDVTICSGSAVTIGGSPTSTTSGVTYAWDNASSLSSATAANPIATPNTTTTYTVTVTSSFGCSNTDQITVTVNPAIVSSVAVDSNVSCNGLSDGGATASATGGTTPYTYSWSNSANTASITALVANSYTVTITDNNGCSSASSVTITEPTPITIVANSVNASCNGSADGSITTLPSGGTSPYTYNWSNSGTTATVSNLAAGTYTVTVTDNNSCTATSTTTITEPTAIINTVTKNLATLTADQGGAIYQWLDCNNGNAPISGETSQTYVATANGDYAVKLTVNGCIDTSACINVTSVGFEELNQQEVALTLYPNPTKGDLNLSLEGESFRGERLRIFDLTGKVISEQIVNGNLIQLDLHNFDSGVYFIEVGNQRKKVILTK